MDSIEKTAIDLKIDLKEGNSTDMAKAGRKIYDKLQHTTLKDWSPRKTSQFLRNKYNLKKRKKNEDEVEVAARVPPGEISGTL